MSFLANIVGSTVQAATNVQDSINAAVNGKPKIAATVKFFEAMGSYDSKKFGETVTDDVHWTTFPVSAKTPVQDRAQIIDPPIWKGIKNFSMVLMSTPLEAEGDRVVAHTRVGEKATTPGGEPCTNEMMWVLTLKHVGNQWKVSDIVEMLDTVARAEWLAQWNKEKAAAAAPADGKYVRPANPSKQLAAAFRFIDTLEGYNLDAFGASISDKSFTYEMFPLSMKAPVRSKAQLMGMVGGMWGMIDGLKTEMLDAIEAGDRIIFHMHSIPPAHGPKSGTPYRNEYIFIFTVAPEGDVYKVVKWREFVDSAFTSTYFPTEAKAQGAENPI